jgi:hypothetical protein
MKVHYLDPKPTPKAVDPATLAASPDLVPQMVSGGNRNGMMGTGDRRGMVYRPGSMDHLKHPSRIGSRLHYADGRIEPTIQHLPADDTEGGAI